MRSDRPAAIDRLIERVQLRVRRWARRFTDDVDSADDVAQEVLIDLAGRIRRYDGRSKFTTWLFTVTRNVALTQRRREQRRARLIAAQPREADDSRRRPAATTEQLTRARPRVLRRAPAEAAADLRALRPARDAAGRSRAQSSEWSR